MICRPCNSNLQYHVSYIGGAEGEVSARECWRASQIKKKHEEQETGRVSAYVVVNDCYVMMFIIFVPDLHLLST
jgi:hypothetical protein